MLKSLLNKIRFILIFPLFFSQLAIAKSEASLRQDIKQYKKSIKKVEAENNQLKNQNIALQTSVKVLESEQKKLRIEHTKTNTKQKELDSRIKQSKSVLEVLGD